MKTGGAKMTFRFPDRKAVGHNHEDQVKTEETESQSSVTWSEWNALENNNSTEEEHISRIHENETKKEPITPLGTEYVDDVNRDLQLLKKQNLTDPWMMEKDDQQSVPHKDNQVMLETDIIHTHEEWTWTHSPVYEDIDPAHTRKRPPAVMKVIGSVIGAVATGLLFTFLALSLIRGEVSLPDVTKSIAAIANSDAGSDGVLPAQQQTDGNGNLEGSPNTAIGDERKQPSITVNIPAAQSYVLQYGVYAKDEGAQQAITELQNLGLGGVLAHDPDGNRRVFAAVSLERDDAMLLSASLHTKEGSIYVRPFDREAITQLAFTGDSNVLNSFMTQSDLVRQWLITQSSKMLQQTPLEAFSVANMDVLRTEHLRWTQWGQQIQKSMGEKAANQWLKMVQVMNTAISAVNEYNKKPASAHLWNIQQACMQYMLLEQEWLAGMKG